MKILVLNAGSSSQKSRLYEIDDAPLVEPREPLWEADIDWAGAAGQAEVTIQRGQGQVPVHQSLPVVPQAELLKQVLSGLWSGPLAVLEKPEEIHVVGHRVVHGGPHFRQSALVTPEMKVAIEKYTAFAPEHNTASLAGMQVISELLPKVAQVAVFDTAFHSDLPLAAVVYPGPYEWYERGIQRYGFHGISHQYCAQRTAQLLGRSLESLRLITCHLGNGCSLAAIRNGRSIDTTMGFTPLDGLMMGSRSGSLDPGILVHLLHHQGYTPRQLDETLHQNSGLKGISGQSADMRVILQARAEGHSRAILAFNMYVHRLREYIGAMLAVLGGLDALVFTGGVGEHSPEVRAAACETLGFLKLQLDMYKNAAPGVDQDIAAPGSAVRVLVVQTQEDWLIARQSWLLTRSAKK